MTYFEAIAQLPQWLARALVEGSLEVTLLVATAALATLALTGEARARRAVLLWVLAASVLLPLTSWWTAQRSFGWLSGSLLDRPSVVDHAAVEVPPSPLAGELTAVTPIERSLVDLRPVKSSQPTSRRALAPGTRAGWLVLVWGLGGLLSLGWQALGLATIARISRQARLAPSRVQTVAAEETARLGTSWPVRILVDDLIAVPMTWGWRRPIVLLPVEAVGWPKRRLRMVLQHELTHVGRRDWLVRLLARSIQALYWFHPLIWWVRRRLVLEQELACDRAVVALGHRPTRYAGELLRLASSRSSKPQTRWLRPAPIAALRMAQKNQMEVRVMSILEPGKRMPTGLVVLVLMALVAVVPALAAMTPWQELRIGVEEFQAEASLTGVVAAAAGPTTRSPVPAQQPTSEPTPSEDQGLRDVARELAEVAALARPLEDRLRALHGEMPEGDLEAIEQRLAPAQRRLAELELELEPYHRQLEELASELEPLGSRMAQLHQEALAEMPELARAELDAAAAAIESKLALAEERWQRGHAEGLHRESEIERELERAAEALARAEQSSDPQSRDRLRAELHERMEQLRRELAPTQRSMEELRLSMEPFQQELQRLRQEMAPAREQMEKARAAIEPALAELRHEMEPIHQRMEEIRRQMEPMRRKMGEVRADMRPALREMAAISESMAPTHDRMEALQRELAPLHRRLEQAHEQFADSLRSEVSAILQQELGLSAAQLVRATDAVLENVHPQFEDGALWVQGSKSRLERILGDHASSPLRIEGAVDRILRLEIAPE